MTLRHRMKEPGMQIQMGLLFLVVGSLSRLFLRPTALIPANLLHGVIGFFYGVSIAFLLIGVWRKSHPRSKREAGPQAF